MPGATIARSISRRGRPRDLRQRPLGTTFACASGPPPVMWCCCSVTHAQRIQRGVSSPMPSVDQRRKASSWISGRRDGRDRYQTHSRGYSPATGASNVCSRCSSRAKCPTSAGPSQRRGCCRTRTLASSHGGARLTLPRANTARRKCFTKRAKSLTWSNALPPAPTTPAVRAGACEAFGIRLRSVRRNRKVA